MESNYQSYLSIRAFFRRWMYGSPVRIMSGRAAHWLWPGLGGCLAGVFTVVQNPLGAPISRGAAPFPAHSVVIEVYGLALKSPLHRAEHPVGFSVVVSCGDRPCQVDRKLILPVPLSSAVRHDVHQEGRRHFPKFGGMAKSFCLVTGSDTGVHAHSMLQREWTVKSTTVS